MPWLPRRRAGRAGGVADAEAEALREHARAWLADGDMDAAIDALGQAALLRPRHAGIHAELGRVLQDAGRIEAARHAYGRAFALDAGQAEALSGMGTLPPLPPRRVNFAIGQEVLSARTTHHGTLNRYTVLAVRRGGFGVVYIVSDAAGDRLALKSFDARFLWSDDDRRRFQREAATWISLDPHPHVVAARWAEEVEGFPCLVMEYVDGGDLSDRLASGPLSPRQAVRFGLHVCDGMQHASRQLGLVHRDLKPSNCMVSRDGRLKVTDFGLARVLREVQEESLDLSGAPDSVRTLYTTVAGTPAYMPPEQYVPGAPLDPRTDVYAFGVMFFQMLTGEIPPPGGRAKTHIARSSATRALPANLKALVLRCVEPNPDKRPAGFAEVRERLEHAHLRLTGTPAPRPSAAREADAATWCERSLAAGSLKMPEEALAAADRGIAMTPTGDDLADSKLWQARGLALVALGRWLEAVEAYDRALELNSHEPSLWVCKGKALDLLDRLAESLACLERCIEIAPGYGSAWRNMAGVLSELERFEQADAAYKRAVELHPRDAGLLQDRAIHLRRSGRPTEALKYVEQALRIEPRSHKAWITRGNLLSDLGGVEDALACFERAVEINPDDRIGWLCKAISLSELHRLEDADAAFERAAELRPTDSRSALESDLYNGWGVNLRLQGRPAEALERTDRALRISPDDPLAWANRARVLGELGRHDEAVASCDRALSLAPDDPYALEVRALLSPPSEESPPART